MPEKPIQETISYLIAWVGRSHRSRIDAALAELGLHVGQEIVLLQLWAENGLTQSELVERMQLEPPTLTKMLQRMEKAGLVERRRDLQDARVCRVYLTKRGYSLQEPVNRCWMTIDERLLSNLTLEEQLLLRRLLLQVRSNLG